MTVMSENYSKLAKLSINHFLTANNKLWRKSAADLKLREILNWSLK